MKNIKHITVAFKKSTLLEYKKLADYLWALPKNYKHFGMKYYCIVDDSTIWNVKEAVGAMSLVSKEDINLCGTAACAVGHAPLAGCGKPLVGEYWHDYVTRVFLEGNIDEYKDVHDWCFSGRWSYVDNTPKGAAQRIYYMLDKGLPLNIEDQQERSAPLSYKKQKPIEIC